MTIRNRELSQFGSFIYVENSTQEIGITTGALPYVGIGTANPAYKLHVYGDTNIQGNFYINGEQASSVVIDRWNAGSANNIYRELGNVGIGKTNPSIKLDVVGNVSAGQFISTVTSGTAPFIITSDTQVTNLNASFLRGKEAPISDIVGTTDNQTLSNKVLSTPTISGAINFEHASLNGPASGSYVITLPAESGTLLTSATGGVISGLVTTGNIQNGTILNEDISDNTIQNAKLANRTISGINLGGSLLSLSFGEHLSSSGSYNGSTARTVSVAATSVNTPNTIVSRNSQGEFIASKVTATNIIASQTIQANNFIGDGSSLTNVGAGLSVSNDTLTNGTFYPVFTQTTVGLASTGRVSTTKLSFNPSTGTLSASNFNSTSDINLKENISTFENALSTVSQLRGVSFDWKETQKPSIGVIAQEIESILPELVNQGETKSVNYNGIIGVLIEAVKELTQEVENLKIQINKNTEELI